MNYDIPEIKEVAEKLKGQMQSLTNKADILKSVELKSLFDEIKTMPADQRSEFGKQVNALRQELVLEVQKSSGQLEALGPIDITAPFDPNLKMSQRPQFLASENGSQHPLTSELNTILDIFYQMGFTAVESKELDDDYHMFSSLNFPEDHPARDDYDTFMTKQQDDNGTSYIAPAHTSSMQNRMLKRLKYKLSEGEAIAAVIPGRVFRNEDLDARHEHTFYQLEGIYVDKGVNVGNLIATLKTFLQSYYQKELEVKTQPFYFPFTEPSFEFALSCPFCDKAGCHICSQTGWIELLGCGMIHPNVLHEGGIDVNEYTGFAWGSGIERLVMMKYAIEDVRYFESGRLDFLRQFK
jgi:phenylalanyl-tRNA synthetase alpha chain